MLYKCNMKFNNIHLNYALISCIQVVCMFYSLINKKMLDSSQQFYKKQKEKDWKGCKYVYVFRGNFLKKSFNIHIQGYTLPHYYPYLYHDITGNVYYKWLLIQVYCIKIYNRNIIQKSTFSLSFNIFCIFLV